MYLLVHPAARPRTDHRDLSRPGVAVEPRRHTTIGAAVQAGLLCTAWAAHFSKSDLQSGGHADAWRKSPRAWSWFGVTTWPCHGERKVIMEGHQRRHTIAQPMGHGRNSPRPNTLLRRRHSFDVHECLIDSFLKVPGDGREVKQRGNRWREIGR